MISVRIPEEVHEEVVRSCTEPGFWTSVFGAYKDKPVWTYTQALGERHVVDFNVYTPRPQGADAEPACCWSEAVIFERDADDPEMLNEVNVVMGDDDPFSAPWRFDLDGKLYEVRFV